MIPIAASGIRLSTAVLGQWLAQNLEMLANALISMSRERPRVIALSVSMWLHEVVANPRC